MLRPITMQEVFFAGYDAGLKEQESWEPSDTSTPWYIKQRQATWEQYTKELDAEMYKHQTQLLGADDAH